MSLNAFASGFKKKSWTIKIIPKLNKEVSVFHFTAFDIFRVGFISVLFFLVFFGYFLIKKNQERDTLSNLQKNLWVKENQLRTVELEKSQVESLLNQKASNLELHLHELKLKEEEIQRLIGKNPKREKSSRSSYVAFGFGKEFGLFRFGQKSSRGGSYNELTTRMEHLSRQIDQEQLEFNQMQFAALKRKHELDEEHARLLAIFEHIPSIWPVTGTLTSGFGYRIHPINGEGEFHQGVDIAMGYASPIHAAASGVCILAEDYNGFGLTVQIDHGNGFVTQYSHCSQLLVSRGATISKGETVALVGSTGYSTGPHLHYQMYYHGSLIDPTPYLGLTVNKLSDESTLRSLALK